MTEHLLRRPDTPVAIHGRARDPYADLLDAGARWHDTACSLAAESSVVLLMLPDLPQVEEVRQTLHTTTNNPPRFRSAPGSASDSQERVRHGDQQGNRQCASPPSDIGTTPPVEGGALERAVGPAQLRRRGHRGKSSCRSRSVVSSERQKRPHAKEVPRKAGVNPSCIRRDRLLRLLSE